MADAEQEHSVEKRMGSDEKGKTTQGGLQIQVETCKIMPNAFSQKKLFTQGKKEKAPGSMIRREHRLKVLDQRTS